MENVNTTGVNELYGLVMAAKHSTNQRTTTDNEKGQITGEKFPGVFLNASVRP